MFTSTPNIQTLTSSKEDIPNFDCFKRRLTTSDARTQYYLLLENQQDFFKHLIKNVSDFIALCNEYPEKIEALTQLFLKAHYSQEMVFELGQKFNRGSGAFDKKMAYMCFRHSAQRRHIRSQFYLGCFYKEGLGVEKNSTKAFIWWEKAALQGYPEAQYNLAYAYGNGDGVKKDESKAFYWYRKVAHRKDADAQYNVACCYRYGLGVKKNKYKAVEWFQKAAEQNLVEAQLALGKCYLEGIGVKKNDKEAFKWWEKAANQGDAQAQFNIGNLFEEGQGVTKNLKQAFLYYKEAAKQKHANAQYYLGFCYEEGLGTKKNTSEAIRYFKKAAKQNHAGAQLKLGVCYEEGSGVKKDINMAIKWYKKAAKQNDMDAAYNLGVLYFQIGGREQKKRGLEYIQIAAKAGHSLAKLWYDNKITTDADDILKNAYQSKECYLPAKLPPRITQVGPYCGSAAFAGGFNYAQLLPFPLYASNYEKDNASQQNNNKEDVVLDQLQLTQFPSDGPQYSIYSFNELAARYNIPECSSILFPKDCTLEEYETTLCQIFRNDQVVILSCDIKDRMPANTSGQSTHWALGLGYWYDENDNCYVLVNHHGLYCAWEVKTLHECNIQLPEENPCAPGDLEEFRLSLFKIPVKHQREMIDHVSPLRFGRSNG